MTASASMRTSPLGSWGKRQGARGRALGPCATTWGQQDSCVLNAQPNHAWPGCLLTASPLPGGVSAVPRKLWAGSPHYTCGWASCVVPLPRER